MLSRSQKPSQPQLPIKKLLHSNEPSERHSGLHSANPLHLSRFQPPHFRGPLAKTAFYSCVGTVRAPPNFTCGFLDGPHICSSGCLFSTLIPLKRKQRLKAWKGCFALQLTEGLTEILNKLGLRRHSPPSQAAHANRMQQAPKHQVLLSGVGMVSGRRCPILSLGYYQ